MVDIEDPPEAETNNGNCENGSKTTDQMTQRNGDCENGSKTTDQMTQRNGDCENGRAFSEQMGFLNGKTNEGSGGGWKAQWIKYCFVPVICVLVTSIVTYLITKLSYGSCPATIDPPCPSGWVEHEGNPSKCYYFSDSEDTWYFSQSNCSASGASLVIIDDQKEMDFIMQSKGPTEYWIALKREKGQPWEWSNGTLFNGWFDIGADGPCAYLNDEKASSTLCETTRNWICVMSAHSA